MRSYFCLSFIYLLLLAGVKVSAAGHAPVDTLPSKILNLTNWKITLPFSTRPDGIADDIKQPELSTYSNKEYFFTNKKGDGVCFKARVDGATTKGSNFPRSELREMINNGKGNAD